MGYTSISRISVHNERFFFFAGFTTCVMERSDLIDYVIYHHIITSIVIDSGERSVRTLDRPYHSDLSNMLDLQTYQNDLFQGLREDLVSFSFSFRV